MTQSLVKSIRPGAQTNTGAEETKPTLIAFHLHGIPRPGVFLGSLCSHFPYHFDVQELIYLSEMPSHRATLMAALWPLPEGWRRVNWDGSYWEHWL